MLYLLFKNLFTSDIGSSMFLQLEQSMTVSLVFGTYKLLIYRLCYYVVSDIDLYTNTY